MRAAVEARGMAAVGDLVLVAISGGPDSTALLHALKQLETDLGVRLRAAHVHHGIRGREADLDAQAAEGLARDLGVRFSLEKVDALAHARRKGLSLETAAREVRYAALEAAARRCRAQRIATGHTMDDQAETVLLNLLRGTGPRGLAGIPPVRGRIIRPLLWVTRREVAAYCKAHALAHRLDRSNLDLAHTRNRIRHRIIPALERIQPAVAPHLAALADIMRDEDEFMSEQAEAAFRQVAEVSKRQVSLRLGAFSALASALQPRVMRMAIGRVKGDERDLDLERVGAAVRLALSGRTGAVVGLPGGIYARRGYEEVAIGHALPAGKPLRQQWELPVPGEAHIPELGIRLTARVTKLKRLPSDPDVAVVDAGGLRYPLVVRTRRRGDRFQPSGMGAEVKLQDFFVNRKVPRERRDGIPLVLSGDQVVWVVGHRVSDRAKVTGDTRRKLRLEAKKLT